MLNPRERLDDYLSSLRERIRLAIFTRAGAALALTVLILICVAVYLLNLRGFPVGGVIVSRIALLISVVALIAGLIWLPLHRLSRDHGAIQLEKQLPEQQGRIETYLEQRDRAQASPLVDLLAEDALKLTAQSSVTDIVSSRRIWIAGAITAAAVIALAILLTVAKSEWGYGSRYVLLGVKIPHDAVPVREVELKPGDATMRRNADLNVQALVKGFKPDNVELFVRFADTNRWEQASMQKIAGEQYGFTLYALRAPLSYYVRADAVQSSEHTIKVVDVPRIEHMQLAYAYPQWTKLPPRIEDDERDIRAVADTQVKLTVSATAPLQDAKIVIDKATSSMQSNANQSGGELTVTKPARYHLESRVAGDMVALTDDYEISVDEDAAPTIEIVKPGRDARATSIEEVPVAIRAKDDFKVQSLELRYAVNGGEWQHVKLPAQSSDVQAKTLLRLEELGGKTPLVPGDLITYYAVTGDRKQSAQTDLFMVQVQPFDRRFTEGQGGGGGGGGGGDSEQQQIADRQRDLLVATWNLDRAREQKRRTPEQLKESAQMLATLEDKLAEQTSTLVERTRARISVDSDARVKLFIESLESAVKAMAPAATNLNALELQKAVPSEQTALQMLQRAESSFRDIQVARSQGNGNGGAARASRDISELYELEMDLSKNKYETEKELSQDSKEQSVDEAVEKLKELARRQQQLAEQRQQQQAPTNAERWKQEQLRREAEQLRRRLQELAQQQAQQSGQKQSGQQQSGQPKSSQSQSSSQSGNDATSALRSVESALQAMRNAEKSNNDQRATEDASRNLQQAAEHMQGSANRPSLSDTVNQLADEATKIATTQRKSEVDMKTALSAVQESENRSRTRRDGLDPEQARRLAETKNQLLSQLQKLEDRLRNTSQSQRRTAPKTSERLGEIAGELSGINVPARISRTIVDLQRGRADQSAVGEGLVTDALQKFAVDLRNTTKIAAQEAEQQAKNAPPDALLSEIAQLRRALQSAQRASANGNKPGNEEGNGQGKETASNQAQQSDGQAGAQSGAQSGAVSGGGGRYANGPIGGALSSVIRERSGDSVRIANGIRQQLNAIQQRIIAGSIGVDDVRALRNMIPQVHRLNGDSPAIQIDLLRSVERLELAALAAAEKARTQLAARSGAAATPTSEEGETVAEYYRRLGGRLIQPSGQ